MATSEEKSVQLILQGNLMPLLLNCQYQFYEMMKAQILNMVLWSQGRNCISGLGVDKTRPRVLLLELQLSMFSTWEPWTPILSWFLIEQYNDWITTGLKPGIVWRGNTSYTYSGVPIWLEAVHAENTLGWSCVFSSCFDISCYNINNVNEIKILDF